MEHLPFEFEVICYTLNFYLKGYIDIYVLVLSGICVICIRF